MLILECKSSHKTGQKFYGHKFDLAQSYSMKLFTWKQSLTHIEDLMQWDESNYSSTDSVSGTDFLHLGSMPLSH